MIQTTDKRLEKLCEEREQVRESHRLLVESQMHDVIEENQITILELSDRLKNLKVVEGVLEDEQHQNSEERDKAVELAREAMVLQRKLRAVRYVREQRQADLLNIENLHANQKKVIGAALAQNQLKRDEDIARERWRRRYHTRMEQLNMSPGLEDGQRENEGRAARRNPQPVNSVRVLEVDSPPRRRRHPRPARDESPDRQEHRHDSKEPATGKERELVDVSDHTTPVEIPAVVDDSFGFSDGGPVVVDEIVESNEQDGMIDSHQELEAPNALSPNEERPVAHETNEASSFDDLESPVLFSIPEILQPNEERSAAQETDGAISSGGLGDVITVVAEPNDAATPEHNPEPERHISDDATVTITAGDQDEDKHSPAVASGGLDDILLLTVTDTPQPNKGIAPEEPVSDGTISPLEDARNVGSEGAEASGGSAGDAGQRTIIDGLGEVISLCPGENPGSPDLPSGGESRGVEYESDRTTQAEIVAQNEEKEDEVDDTEEIEIIFRNQQPEDEADDMEDVDVITFDTSTQTYLQEA
jgi:hypothetical protein